MSSARLGAFAQCIARMVVQREVAIAHEGDNFRNMRVLVFIVYASRFWLLTPPPQVVELTSPRL